MINRVFRRLVLAAPLMLGPLAACGGHTAPPGAVFVVDRPPRPRVEVRGARPETGWVWLPGHYRWDGRGYLWDGGRWDRIPRGMKRWVPGQWDHSRQGWYWVEGRWR